MAFEKKEIANAAIFSNYEKYGIVYYNDFGVIDTQKEEKIIL